MYRITLTPSIVNRASNIAFVVEGSKKASALKQVIEGNIHQSLPIPNYKTIKW